jgi:photosystem II stability/assembly factor-like uncharacterized protein
MRLLFLSFLTFFCLMSMIADAGSSVTLKAVNDDTPDWKNISQFQNVSPAGPDLIWVVTVKGDLLRVSSKGESHSVAEVGAAHLVAFRDSTHGWVVDRKSGVWVTSDGGNAWRNIFAPPRNVFYLPQQLTFVDDLNGWLVGIFKVWQTSDGGKSWQEKFSGSSNSDKRIGRLYRGAFIGDKKAWVTSSGGVVIQTSDGGSTWKTAAPEQTDLHDVVFADEQTGWMIGRPRGGVFSTSDNGKTWRLQFAREATYLNSIHFVNGKEGWAVGWTIKDQDRLGLVLHSLDGGIKWVEVATGLRERFFERVCLLDRFHGWLIARDAIYHTDDAGKNFRKIFSLAPFEEKYLR